MIKFLFCVKTCRYDLLCQWGNPIDKTLGEGQGASIIIGLETPLNAFLQILLNIQYEFPGMNFDSTFIVINNRQRQGFILRITI